MTGITAAPAATHEVEFNMQVVTPDSIHLVSDLFAEHRRRRHLIDHGIENEVGTAFVDSPSHPAVAVLTVGRVTLFGGDPEHPSAKGIVASLSGAICTPEDDTWSKLIREVHGSRIESWRRVEFDSGNLDPTKIEEITNRPVDGLRIERVDEELAVRLAHDVGGGFFGKFRSLEQFLDIGFGYCGIVDESVVSGATTGVVCERGIGIQVETHSEYQRMGIGTSCGSPHTGLSPKRGRSSLECCNADLRKTSREAGV